MLTHLRHMTWKAGLLAMLVSLLGFTIALAASGGLDTTFSGDGKQRTDFSNSFNDILYGLALQSDGKIVAVGTRYDPANLAGTARNFALARYNKNGTLDSTFSGDGKQLTDFSQAETARDVAIQSDGKIVVSGEKCNTNSVCDLAVARYNSGGTLDTTFNGTGKKVLNFGTASNGTWGGLRLQSDGKIVIAGYMLNSSSSYDFAVYRLNADGSPDSSFGGDGRVNFGFGASRQDFGLDLLLQSGKILVVGETCSGIFTGCHFALARLTSDGVLDSTFSGDGKQTTDFGANDSAWGVALQPDGKIVAVGDHALSLSSKQIAVARYGANGTLDATFNGTGKKVISFGTYASGQDVLVQADGKIVLAGLGNNDFALVRLKSDGSLDTTFSGDGKASVAFGTSSAVAQALVRQGDGKYVVGGHLYNGQFDFGLARVLP